MQDLKIVITTITMFIVGIILYQNPIKTDKQKAISCIDTASTKNIACECLKKYSIKDTVYCK